jgi:hypothetical protein
MSDWMDGVLKKSNELRERDLQLRQLALAKHELRSSESPSLFAALLSSLRSDIAEFNERIGDPDRSVEIVVDGDMATIQATLPLKRTESIKLRRDGDRIHVAVKTDSRFGPNFTVPANIRVEITDSLNPILGASRHDDSSIHITGTSTIGRAILEPFLLLVAKA